MRNITFCLLALAAAAPAGAVLAEPTAALSAAQPGAAGLPDVSRFIYGTPGAEYPIYGGVPKEFWPYGDKPYYRYFVTRMPFRGPGRNYPPPADLKSLRVGLINSPRYGADWNRSESTRAGIVQAIEEANATRRPDELPFELVEHEGLAQWGGAANLAALLADESVLGYLGMIDGTDAHVALRVTLKTEIVMINTSDPDPSLTETQIPWLLRVLPDQRQELAKLATYVVRQCGCKRIAILRSGDRMARVGSHMFMEFVRRLGCPAAQELLFKPGSTDVSYQLAAIKESRPEAVFFLGEPADIGRYAKQFRAAGVTARFFGTDLMMEDGFRKNAGDAAEGTVFTYFFDAARRDPLWTGFAARFRARWNHEPDVYAAYAYDGAQIMLSAIRRAGPNRWQIRDLVCNVDYYQGVTGWMRIDGTGSNIAPMRLARFEHGQVVFEPEPEFTPKLAQR